MAGHQDIDVTVPPELLFALKSLQHQLANSVGAVLSHVTLLGPACSDTDVQMVERLSQAADQSLAVAKSLRLIVDAYTPGRDAVPIARFMENSRGVLRALLNEAVPIDADVSDDLPTLDARVALPLYTCIIFADRHWLRSADAVSLRADRAADGSSVQLTITPNGADPGKRTADYALQLSADVMERLDHFGVRVAASDDCIELGFPAGKR